MKSFRPILLLLLVSCSTLKKTETSTGLPPEIVSSSATSGASVWDGSVASEQKSRVHPTVGQHGMVVADDREAAEWGVEVLRKGGNAIDAAVATAFAMSVTRPHYASLGGGGFLIYCPRPTGAGAQPCTSIDYRETAPGKATRDMYIRNGKADTGLSQDGALASGTPGVPAGLLMALQKYGTKPRRFLLSRPIELALKGFSFSAHAESVAYERWSAMNGEARRIFGCLPGQKGGGAKGSQRDLGAGGKPCLAHTLMMQPDLAKVLKAISDRGADGFYQGWVAEKIAKGVQAAGGIISLEDLAAYMPIERAPVHADFHDLEIWSMAPPSAGGTLVAQMLEYTDIAEREGRLSQGFGSASTIHALAHMMGHAFADRAEYFGDPDRMVIPTAKLLDRAYVAEQWKTFDPARAKIPPGPGDLSSASMKEGQQTTHFSVMDGEGNAVAVTTTINDNYGSGFVPPGTGIVMNNEMDDFSVEPGVPNLFGLVGKEANAVGPGKRPLSSMSPSIVRDHNGNAKIVIGAAGGPTITTSVFLSLVNRLVFGMSLPDSVSAPRFHEQWRPLKLKVEKFGFSAETGSALKNLGYELSEVPAIAKVHALERFSNGRVWGIADIRGEGAAVAE